MNVKVNTHVYGLSLSRPVATCTCQAKVMFRLITKTSMFLAAQRNDSVAYQKNKK